MQHIGDSLYKEHGIITETVLNLFKKSFGQ